MARRNTTVNTSSKKTRRIGSRRDSTGIRRARPHTEVLGPNAMRERQVADAQHLEDRINGVCILGLILIQFSTLFTSEMDETELRNFQDLHELPDADVEDNEDWFMLDSVLDGTQRVDISHEGGELAALNTIRKDMAHG